MCVCVCVCVSRFGRLCIRITYFPWGKKQFPYETKYIFSNSFYENINILVDAVDITQAQPLTKVFILRVGIP